MPRFSLLLALAASAPLHAQTSRPASRPNIVFILADDWGWGDLGCYGHRQLRTPHLDRLASQGIRFTHFYSCGSVCSPSRAAWLTGRFPARVGIHGHFAEPDQNKARGMPNYLDPKVPTLARLLKEVDYATAHVGKWHLGHSPDAPPVHRYGFDESWSVLSSQPDVFRSTEFRAQSSTLFIDRTIDFIERHRDKPFYVQTWLLDTHARLQPTAEQMAPYARLRGATKIYYSAATDADKQIGRLLKRLDELGLSQNTIVIFSSDNGPEDIGIGNASEHGVGSPGPFRGRKRSLYDGGIRVPFILRWPQMAPAGRVDNQTVMCAADFLPTLCALTGVPGWTQPAELNPRIDGEDMSAAWQGRDVPRRRPIFWEWRFHVFGHVLNASPILAMREGGNKLLMNPDRSRIELYDIPSDRSELNNLQGPKPEVVSRMSMQLLAWAKTLPPGPHDPTAGANSYPWPR
jgi:N-acetylgalactosamine-6-sulfatase